VYCSFAKKFQKLLFFDLTLPSPKERDIVFLKFLCHCPNVSYTQRLFNQINNFITFASANRHDQLLLNSPRTGR
jgi:hypothetical protein